MSFAGWILDIFNRRDDVKVFKIKVKLDAWTEQKSDSIFVGRCPVLDITVEASTMKDAEARLRTAVATKLGDDDE